MSAPIASVVERVYGNPEHEQYYTRAYFNWVHLLYMIDPRQGKFDQAKFDELALALSETQLSSISLLREWWDGDIQEKELSEKATKAILTAAMVPLMDDVDLRDTPASVRDIVTSCRGDTLLEDPGFLESSYHSALLQLWKAEFYLLSGNFVDTQIQTTRRWAAVAASNQRIAWSCFESALGDATTLQLSAGQGRRDFTFPLRSTLAICPWLGLHKKRIANQGTMDGLPYYLWDVKRQRTVKVDSLSSRPRYIAVSHTWGRWMLPDEPPANIDNVPWPVPQNSRFNILELPRRLSEVITTTPYMWIDLFCIPQGKADPDLCKIMNAEIARQGEIFTNANGAMIWFNDVKDWGGLESAVLWFAAKFIQVSRSKSKAGATAIEPWLQFFDKEADQPTGLFESYDYSDVASVQAATPSGWFSSLWTLQEACLRPDMILVDRNWRLFAVGPKNLVVTLDNLIALEEGLEVHEYMSNPVEISTEDIKDLPKGQIIQGSELGDAFMSKVDPLPEPEDYKLRPMPRGPVELWAILRKFEMAQMLDAKPATILALANQRYCKSSRAQAIMSVVGATKWFTNHLGKFGSAPPEDELVLGRYAFGFVKEVRKQLGAQFFCSPGSGFEMCPQEIYERGADNKIVRIKPVGSLMPFSVSDHLPKRAINFLDTSKDHPSVATWEVLSDGTCVINQAVILSSFKPASPDIHGISQSLRVRALVHNCEGDPHATDEELHQLLQEYSPRFNIYAVILTYGPTTRDCSGVILQEVLLPGAEDHPHILDKTQSLLRYHPPSKLILRVGLWRLWDWKCAPELPNPMDVDWRVL